MKLAMKITYNSFYEIAKTTPGSYYLRNLISKFPASEIMKLKGKFKNKYQEQF